MLLKHFNQADSDELTTMLRPCLDVHRWIDEIVQARPFVSLEQLLSHAQTAAEPFTAAELATAMTHHPRIGVQAAGDSAEATLSRKEQSGVDPANRETNQALAIGNKAYEEKFAQVFLIRAAGRTPQEILTALDQRLLNTPEQEAPIVAAQLREIAVLRLKGVLDT